MMDLNQPLNAWQWLEERNWKYVESHDGYQAPDKKLFISNMTMYRRPGDVIYFLKTGYVRDIAIFDTGFFTPKAEDLGFKVHKDGTCVALKRVK